MGKNYKRFMIFILLVNFAGISGFWTIFLLNPSEPVTLELRMHIITEYLTGLMALVSLILILQSHRFSWIALYFSLGMIFYASLQATGWAITNNMLPLLSILLLNLVFIPLLLLNLMRNPESSFTKNL